jgi:lysophospholipase L1-like esterase
MKTIRYLALGDSYTIGEGVEPASAFPAKLLELLCPGADNGVPETVATTGWTTGELLAAMDERNLTGPYDLVTLLIGVNNQYRGYDFSVYREEYSILLARAIHLAGGPGQVLAVSIPDYGITPFGSEKSASIDLELQAYNAEAARQCRLAGVEWADLYALSKNPDQLSDWLADDQLHPSALQYRLWAEALLPHTRTRLQMLPEN